MTIPRRLIGRALAWLRESNGESAARSPFKSRINELEMSAGNRVIKRAGKTFRRKGITFDPAELLAREAEFLKLLRDSPHFPTVCEQQEGCIVLTYEGDLITKDNLPQDWRQQAEEILAALDAHHIVHRDIKQINLLVNSGRIVLIDFGWAILESEPYFSCPQEIGEQIPPELINDNRTALYAALEKLDRESQD